MATRSEHATKVRENKTLLADLDVAGWPQWTTTISFCSALHLLEQLLATCDLHPQGHKRRNELFAELHPLAYTTYYNLYTASRHARYESSESFLRKFPIARVRNVVSGSWLAVIEQYVEVELQRVDNRA